MDAGGWRWVFPIMEGLLITGKNKVDEESRSGKVRRKTAKTTTRRRRSGKHVFQLQRWQRNDLAKSVAAPTKPEIIPKSESRQIKQRARALRKWPTGREAFSGWEKRWKIQKKKQKESGWDAVPPLWIPCIAGDLWTRPLASVRVSSHKFRSIMASTHLPAKLFHYR